LIEEKRITSFLLSFLQQQVLQVLRQQQVLPVRARPQGLQERLVLQAQALLLFCHRQQVPKRSGRRRGFAWSWS
jgi:hypothetical protein